MGRKIRRSGIQKIAQEHRAEAFASKFGEQVRQGPKDVEGLMDVPGLNLINPIASYATFDPVPRVANLADEATLEEDPAEKQ